MDDSAPAEQPNRPIRVQPRPDTADAMNSSTGTPPPAGRTAAVLRRPNALAVDRGNSAAVRIAGGSAALFKTCSQPPGTATENLTFTAPPSRENPSVATKSAKCMVTRFAWFAVIPRTPRSRFAGRSATAAPCDPWTNRLCPIGFRLGAPAAPQSRGALRALSPTVIAEITARQRRARQMGKLCCRRLILI